MWLINEDHEIRHRRIVTGYNSKKGPSLWNKNYEPFRERVYSFTYNISRKIYEENVPF